MGHPGDSPDSYALLYPFTADEKQRIGEAKRDPDLYR